MSYSHEALCKYLNWTAYTLRITGWFFSHVLLQLCRKRWWGHLHVNLQTKPVIHQHFLNKELFPNRPSSPNILIQCCVERTAWTLSTVRISSSQSLSCINPPPAHALPYWAIYAMSSLIPHSSLMESALEVSVILQKIPPSVAGGERLVREKGD